MTRQQRWLNTSLDAQAQRKALRIATAARKASRAFDRWWKWSGVDENKEAAAFDVLVARMSDLKVTIHDKADRL